MIVQRFLSWVQNAPAGARAEATGALARAWLHSDLGDRDRDDAEIALTSMLDDPSPLVRRCLAEAFAGSREAPPHCVAALARDQSDIAAVVLARSPLLSDADLVDCAGAGDVFAQSAVALRPGLSAAVATALTEVGYRETLISLAVNPAADVPESALRRMIERFGDDGEMREAILARPGLSSGLRAELVRATASALADFVVARAWMPEHRASRMAREEIEKGAVAIAVLREDGEGAPELELAASLRRAGLLTPALALRAALSGARGFFIALLAELSGLDAARVAGLVTRPGGSGFAALCARAKLPASLVPAFAAALETPGDGESGRLSRAAVSRVRRVCEAASDVSGALKTALRNLEIEAVREEARRARTASFALASEAAPTPAAPPVITIDFQAIEAQLAA